MLFRQIDYVLIINDYPIRTKIISLFIKLCYSGTAIRFSLIIKNLHLELSHCLESGVNCF